MYVCAVGGCSRAHRWSHRLKIMQGQANKCSIGRTIIVVVAFTFTGSVAIFFHVSFFTNQRSSSCQTYTNLNFTYTRVPSFTHFPIFRARPIMSHNVTQQQQTSQKHKTQIFPHISMVQPKMPLFLQTPQA